MSDPLYRKEVLRLAADAVGGGRLPPPCASATAANPVCGDRVTIDLAIEEGRIKAVAQQAMACVLVQGSASILGAGLAGLTRAEVAELRDRVGAMLEGGETPPAPFGAYGAFDGVRGHKGRHACVLLPFEAALAAFDASETQE